MGGFGCKAPRIPPDRPLENLLAPEAVLSLQFFIHETAPNVLIRLRFHALICIEIPRLRVPCTSSTYCLRPFKRANDSESPGLSTYRRPAPKPEFAVTPAEPFLAPADKFARFVKHAPCRCAMLGNIQSIETAKRPESGL